MCKHDCGVALYPPPEVGGFTATNDKIAHAEKVALLTKQIYELQKRMYKEKQFNRQVEMNLQLQTLQKQLKDLTR